MASVKPPQEQEDEEFSESVNVEADDYEIAVNPATNELRVLFRNERGVLSTQAMEASDAYEFAQKILRGYDKLEGI